MQRNKPQTHPSVFAGCRELPAQSAQPRPLVVMWLSHLSRASSGPERREERAALSGLSPAGLTRPGPVRPAKGSRVMGTAPPRSGALVAAIGPLLPTLKLLFAGRERSVSAALAQERGAMGNPLQY